MNCQSCNVIEGFISETPAFYSRNLPTQDIVGQGQTQDSSSPYLPYMKSGCSDVAQPCIYTTQGVVICPKNGLGNCNTR